MKLKKDVDIAFSPMALESAQLFLEVWQLCDYKFFAQLNFIISNKSSYILFYYDILFIIFVGFNSRARETASTHDHKSFAFKIGFVRRREKHVEKGQVHVFISAERQKGFISHGTKSSSIIYISRKLFSTNSGTNQRSTSKFVFSIE